MIHGIDTGFLVAAEVAEHVDHVWARETLEGMIAAGDFLAIAPQVLAEFIHIATDPRRFARPLDMAAARQLAEQWWTAREVMHTFANDAAIAAIPILASTIRTGPQTALGHASGRYLFRGRGCLGVDHEPCRFRGIRHVQLHHAIRPLIVEQSDCSSAGHQAFAQVASRRLGRFDHAARFGRGIVALPQVFIDRTRIGEVIADYGVRVRQAERVEGLDDALGGFASPEGVNNQLQQHPAIADAEDTRRVLAQGAATDNGSNSARVVVDS